LGLNVIERKDVEQTAQALGRLTNHPKLRLRSLTLLGESLYVMGHFSSAERAFQEVLSVSPRNIVAHRWLESLYFDIGVYGTIWIMLIAYVTRFLPYGMRYASTSMLQIHKELEESAAMSGASWTMAFRRIVLPLLKPGLLAGWIYVMIVSIRELSSSILLYSPGTEVVSIMIWELWQNGQYVELSALGVMLIILLFCLVMIAQFLGKRFGISES